MWYMERPLCPLLCSPSSISLLPFSRIHACLCAVKQSTPQGCSSRLFSCSGAFYLRDCEVVYYLFIFSSSSFPPNAKCWEGAATLPKNVSMSNGGVSPECGFSGPRVGSDISARETTDMKCHNKGPFSRGNPRVAFICSLFLGAVVIRFVVLPRGAHLHSHGSSRGAPVSHTAFGRSRCLSEVESPCVLTACTRTLK